MTLLLGRGRIITPGVFPSYSSPPPDCGDMPLSYSAPEIVHDAAFPLCEVAGDYMLARVSYKPQVEAEVVYARYLHGKQLLCLEEMV